MRISDTSDLWWKTAVIYCLDVQTFMDWNDDGMGDFRGLAERLDYLSELGVTCLWLMPFYPTADRDDGYDITDYYGVDPRLGSSGDFVEVVRTDCGVPATTSVTSLCHASDSAVPTSSVPVERTAICSARWMRSRLSREGRTTLPPIARGGPLGEAARWKTPGPGGSLRSHECPTLPNPQPSLQP